MQNTSGVLSVYCLLLLTVFRRCHVEYRALVNKKDSPVHKLSHGDEYFSQTTEEMNPALNSVFGQERQINLPL